MEINIAYGNNEEYTRYGYLSIFSILKHSSLNDKIIVYFFTLKGNKFIPDIKNLEKIYSNFELRTIFLEEKKYKHLMKTKSYMHFATFFRFEIDSLENIEKLIYIDSDTIVNSNIGELFREDLGGNIIGACSDMPTKSTKKLIKDLQLKTGKYFNAGVLLINLKKRKSFHVSEKCIDLLSKKSYECHDQDTLNIILENKRQVLPGKYNVASGYFSFIDGIEEFQYVGFNREYYIDAIKNPAIIHYTGGIKPRHLINEHPLRHIYDDNLYESIGLKNNLKPSMKEYLILLAHYIEGKILKYKTRRLIVNKIKKLISK